MAINLQTVNVLPPNVPSNRGRMANNPSFGFSGDVGEIRRHKAVMDEIAGDRSNPLARVAKVGAVLGEVAITAITTKVALSTSSEAIAKSAKFKKFVTNKKTGLLPKAKRLIVKYAKRVKASRVSKKIIENAQLLKNKIKSTKIGGWIFKKADAFKKNKTVVKFSNMIKTAFKSIAGHTKENTTNAIGALAGAGVLAKEMTSSGGNN